MNNALDKADMRRRELQRLRKVETAGTELRDLVAALAEQTQKNGDFDGALLLTALVSQFDAVQVVRPTVLAS